ncbi:superoxide dismutase [Megalodesulfovibrio gigas]|uniref:Superoxide dismutase n=1 Tax=Megalodesulfovibrio gigas (strain ATCC 19364 / DSM 1382 / NCIMB 9332 / VKM B-1759) TaxID=1121448 RepID=T2GB68_MEGG1|nr:superoxide dismutase [Megalodesulfovibrio gigas]AGW13376.1 putative Superoxide dismutase [Megalodesulfovibrio gigas DSM 1382 = ATCC 19364]
MHSCNSSCLPRREFLKTVALGTAVAAVAASSMSSIAFAQTPADGPVVLPALPYAPNALEPVISANTLGFHHGKHHAGYVANTNRLLKDSGIAATSLEDIVKAAAEQKKQGLFNNAAQVYNHNLYWQSLTPGGGNIPAAMQELLTRDFGSVDAAKKALADCAVNRFASGWAWLVADPAAKNTLKIVDTMNAETPLTMGLTPLLVIDVWEHAYYLDYQNKRADYAKAVIDKLLNWDAALARLQKTA